QIEPARRAVPPDLGPYCVEVRRLDVSDEPERGRAAVRRCFDSESHLRVSKANDGPWLTTSVAGCCPQRGCRRNQQLPTGRRLSRSKPECVDEIGRAHRRTPSTVT